MGRALDYGLPTVVAGIGFAMVVGGAGEPPPRWEALAGAVLLIIGALWLAQSLLGVSSRDRR